VSAPTALYVPGSRPDRFDKAASSGADVVILDLEDSVAPADKEDARAAVAAWATDATVPVQVRVNAPGGEDFRLDLAALPSDVELRLPKVEAVADLGPVAGRRVHAILESALGVERAFEIARSPEVASLSLGEADLAAELGLDGDEAFGWIRSRVVVAARAAGLPAPMMSVYADVEDLDGLARSCTVGRRLGMRGRAAIHPRQVPIIRDAFAATSADREWAAQVLAVLEGSGVGRLPDGSMVDAAMARRARGILDAR
jgi:citrate lyase subunit beta / citryl-CoA lyase